MRVSKMSLALVAGAGVVPLMAYSNVYLTEEQAIAAIFPGEKLVRKTIELKPDEIRKIEDASGGHVRSSSLIAWVSAGKNVILIDQALGKHEFITYALGLTPKKTVKGIEILEYRETYGYQIRNEDWRRQFYGKDVSAPLKLGKDIVNISGATLSSAHITAGVRRLLHTYEIVRNRF